MQQLQLQVRGNAVRFRVRAKPKSSKSRVLGVRHGALEVALAAPPVQGRANVELIRTLAAHFGLAKTAVNIVSGAFGHTKLVSLAGITVDQLRARLVPGP
jgi:uncharacterized protein (TIGR00251 family)